jgi:cell division septal protein FtsQ
VSRVAALRRGLPGAGVAAPADRRFRRPDVRPGRRRRIGRVIARGALVALAAVVAFGATAWSVHAVRASPWLAVSRITVRGNARVSTGEIEALLDGARGQNVLLVDLEQYRRRLMDSPWLAGATLRRVLPGTIEVRVVERTPMALARLGRQVYLVDSAGVIMAEFGPQYHDLDLPVVDGLVRTPGGRGPVVEFDSALLVGQLLADVRAEGDLWRRLSQIDVSSAHDAVVLLDNDPALVHLGDTRFAQRLRTYLELAPALHERLEQIDYVDMRFDERVYVKSKGRVSQLK